MSKLYTLFLSYFHSRIALPFVMLFMVSGLAFGQYQPELNSVVIEEEIVTVYDLEMFAPLISVYIHNKDLSFQTQTDLNGKASLSNLNPEDTIYFELVSYETKKISIADIKAMGWRVMLNPSTEALGEVVVMGASKRPEKSRSVPSIVDVIDQRAIARINPQTSADLLKATGNVFVQKSQMGGGSPIIRGFEANKVLIVMDGVRMNNAIYRSGHLQNVISIDNASLDRVEVIYGPSSVIYGSDALGGVMHFYSLPVKFEKELGKENEIGAFARYSSANQEKTVHLDHRLAGKNWGTVTSITLSDFSDLRAGNNRKSQYPDFGLRNFYVERINEIDSILSNENPNVQIGTSYRQIDFLHKVKYQPTEYLSLEGNLQFSTTSNIPRYDQLMQFEASANDPLVPQSFEFSQWDYGPQSRIFGAATANYSRSNVLFSNARVIAAFQNIDEDRITRQFQDNWRRLQREDVSVFSLNADLIKNLNKDFKLLYGYEYTYNYVKSDAIRVNINDNSIDERVQTRYPDGGSRMRSQAAYITLQTHLGEKDRMTLNGGLRYSAITLKSAFVDTSFFSFPDFDIRLDTRALTGSLGMAWILDKGFNIHTTVSTAFRAPNVDDFGKVRSKNGFVTIPNPELVSEKSVNTELTLQKSFKNRLRLSATSYYTYLFDAIVQERCTFDAEAGESLEDCLLYYDTQFDTTVTNVNAGEAVIFGISGNILYRFNKVVTLSSSINYTYGHNISNDEPLAHIPPIFGQARLMVAPWKFADFELTVDYNGWKRLERYAPDSSDNPEYATPEGTPSWMTFNLYANYTWKVYQLNVGLENIMDQHYRLFSSGVSAAGRNFKISLRGRF